MYVVSDIRLSVRSLHSVDQRHAFAAFGQPALALGLLGSVQQTIRIVTMLLNGIFHTGDIKPGKEHSKKLTKIKKKKNTFFQHKWKTNYFLLCDIGRVYCMYCPLQVLPQHFNWTEICTLIGPSKTSTDGHLAKFQNVCNPFLMVAWYTFSLRECVTRVTWWDPEVLWDFLMHLLLGWILWNGLARTYCQWSETFSIFTLFYVQKWLLVLFHIIQNLCWYKSCQFPFKRYTFVPYLLLKRAL